MENIEKNKENKVEHLEPKVKKLFIRKIPQIDQSKTLREILPYLIPSDWKDVFREAQDDLDELSDILEIQEKTYGQWYPLKKDLFRAFDLTKPTEIKVVLFGQDCYPSLGIDGLPRPTGCSFSVRRTDAIPGSLKNIFTELRNEYPTDFTYPSHGCLDSWARQGILLLNRCLTVKPNEPGSHGQIWDGFLTYVLKTIEKARPQCIYILLGKEAQKIKKYLSTKSIFLEAAHPSSRNSHGGFLGCGIFLKTNEHLIKMGEKPINWNLG